MDTRTLIILLLISLGLVIGAVIALWWRERRRGGSTHYPTAGRTPPAPARRREEPDQTKRQPTGQSSPPPRPPSAAPGGLFGRPPTTGSAPPAEAGTELEATRPSAPVSPSPVPMSKPTAPQEAKPPAPQPAMAAPPAFAPPPPPPPPAPAKEKAPAPEQPLADEEETEATLTLSEEKPPELPRQGAAPEPSPAAEQPLAEAEDDLVLEPTWKTLPVESDVDFAEMSPEQLAGWMRDAAQAKSEDESVTRAGTASVDVAAFGKAVQTVLFSAYYPKEVTPEKWQPLHAYIFRAIASAAVEEDAGKQLGERVAEFRGVRAPAKAAVPEGALVTATPHIDGFQFNPPRVTLGFYKDWHRFDFEARAKDAPLNQAANGLLTFSVEGIIIADIPLSIYVGEMVASGTQANAVAKLYQSIFCSYSHQDQQIVARAERAYKALGLDYLRDVVSLKSGQEWSDELRNLISRADVFQLFWSHAAAQSEHVRYEWEHALQVAGWKANFIRPVYWEEPKPDIPMELRHIHFAYQPDLGE